MRARWYVGYKTYRSGQTIREAFKSASAPTQETHGVQYGAVWGPFRTKQGAEFGASAGATNNPHVQSVADAERIAKDIARRE